MTSPGDAAKVGTYNMQFVVEFDTHSYDDLVPIVPPNLSLSFIIDLQHPCYDTAIVIDPNILASQDITQSLYHPAYAVNLDFATYVTLA